MSNILPFWITWNIQLVVIVAIVSSFLMMKPTWENRNGIHWAVISLIMLIVVPMTHRLFFDEDIYLGIGMTIAHNHKALLCTYGVSNFGIFECLEGELNKQGHGLPGWFGLWLRILSPHYMHYVGAVLMGLNSLLLFQLGRGFGLSKPIAILGSLLPLTSSTIWQWSLTTSAEPLTFTLILLMVRMGLTIGSDKIIGILALITTSTWLTYMRWETGVVSVILLLTATPYWPWRMKLIGIGSMLTLSIPHALQFLQVRHDSWGAVDVARFSMEHVLPNLKTNVMYFLTPSRFQPLMFVFVFSGMRYASRALNLGFGTSFLFLFGILLPFYAGSYDYGADDRFAIPAQAFLHLWALMGLTVWQEFVATRFPRAHFNLLLIIFVIMIASAFPRARLIGEEAWLARFDHQIAHQADLAEGSLTFSHNPHLFHLRNRSGAQLEYLLDSEDKVQEFFKSFAPIYYHRNYWCTVYEGDETENICDKIEQRYERVPVLENTQKGYTLGIYELKAPKTDTPPKP